MCSIWVLILAAVIGYCYNSGIIGHIIIEDDSMTTDSVSMTSETSVPQTSATISSERMTKGMFVHNVCITNK